MRSFIKGLVAAAAIGGVSIAAVQPAEARDHTGAAVVAGVIGLGVGAAIASSAHDRYYDRGYYDAGYQPYYGGGGGYYAPSYGVVYDRGYYGRRDWRDHDDRRGWDHDRGEHRGWDHDRGDRGRW